VADAFTEFGLILVSIWESETESLVQRVAATDIAGAQLLFAADRFGHRHILAPIPDDYVFTPSMGVAVEMTEWRNPSGQRYLDLVCKVESLASVFCRLADSVVERVRVRREPCALAVQGALVDWQSLLRPIESLGEEALRGLFGELKVLQRLAAFNAVYAVDAWMGPHGNVHDFETPNGHIEVKTSKREGRAVEISSLNQLDQPTEVALCLIRVRVETSPNGQNISDLVDDLVALGCLRAVLVEKMSMVGFQLGVTDDSTRFTVSEPPLAWRVGPSFPGLRTSDIPEARRAALTRIKYTLDLLNAPDQMTDEELARHLERMMTR
jgi:hypothetical protein